jgi:hypothetical protein
LLIQLQYTLEKKKGAVEPFVKLAVIVKYKYIYILILDVFFEDSLERLANGGVPSLIVKFY